MFIRCSTIYQTQFTPISLTSHNLMIKTQKKNMGFDGISKKDNTQITNFTNSPKSDPFYDQNQEINDTQMTNSTDLPKSDPLYGQNDEKNEGYFRNLQKDERSGKRGGVADYSELVPELLEKIFIGLNVTDLIRCKTVCKSWHSFISSTYFIKAHMNHSYSNDRNNNKFGLKRIYMSCNGNKVGDGCYKYYRCDLLGSSNGLVCIYAAAGNQIFVVNPSTREVKKLPSPRIRDMGGSRLCWGFGYDSSSDDYKVVLGFPKGKNQTCFKIFTLKSNVWKVVGVVKFTCIYRLPAGMLCSGAFHWFMMDQIKKVIIMSFDLSKEEFTTIPQPNEMVYERADNRDLGIIDECLCIFYPCSSRPIWVIKKYIEQQSWTMFPSSDFPKSNYEAYYLKNLKDYISHSNLFVDVLEYIPKEKYGYYGYPTYVQTLVSPHVNGCIQSE